MKKFKLLVLSSLLIGAISCSSDDSSPSDEGNEVAINQEEETVLDPANVSQGITIEGATRNTGNPPTPNGQVNFTLDNTAQSAFLNSGFDITFNAPANFAGTYIQIVNNGDVAGDYLDVPSTAIRSTKKHTSVFSKSSKMDDNEVEIDVDFGDAIPPGKFCYIICIYDQEGNISDPVEVCVEVEAWAGNPALVGTWNYTKQIENGVTILPGEESDCASATVTCTNNDEIVVENAYCYLLDAFKLTINSDGTYEYRSDDTERYLDFQASGENCEAVFSEGGSGYYVSKGKWAYDEEEGRMTLVEFEYVEASGDQVYEGTEENGYVDFDGDVTVTGSDMVVKFSYEEDIVYNIEFFLSK